MIPVCAICGEDFWQEVGYPKLDPPYEREIVLCLACIKNYKMLAGFAQALGRPVAGATILTFMALDHDRKVSNEQSFAGD